MNYLNNHLDLIIKQAKRGLSKTGDTLPAELTHEFISRCLKFYLESQLESKEYAVEVSFGNRLQFKISVLKK